MKTVPDRFYLGELTLQITEVLIGAWKPRTSYKTNFLTTITLQEINELRNFCTVDRYFRCM